MNTWKNTTSYHLERNIPNYGWHHIPIGSFPCSNYAVAVQALHDRQSNPTDDCDWRLIETVVRVIDPEQEASQP